MAISPYRHAHFAKSISSIKSLPSDLEAYGISPCQDLFDEESQQFEYPFPALKLQGADPFTQHAILDQREVAAPKAELKKAIALIPKNPVYAYNLTHSYVNGVKDQGARFVKWLNGKITIDTKRSLNDDIQSKKHRFTEHNALIVELPAKKPPKAKQSPATLMPPKQKRPSLKRNRSSEKNPFKQIEKRFKPRAFTLPHR